MMSLFTQNQRITFDEQLNALDAVGDEAIAENETFACFKLNFEPFEATPYLGLVRLGLCFDH